MISVVPRPGALGVLSGRCPVVLVHFALEPERWHAASVTAFVRSPFDSTERHLTELATAVKERADLIG